MSTGYWSGINGDNNHNTITCGSFNCSFLFWGRFSHDNLLEGYCCICEICLFPTRLDYGVDIIIVVVVLVSK
jgi:hypothetical protein